MKPRALSPVARIEPLGSSMANTTAEPKILGPDWMKNGDLVLSVSVVGILMVMLLPLPRLILDLLLSLSITFSVVILLVSMHVRRPLEFSAFPSILLVGTLLRFSLNIAATRLILLHGNEGQGAAGDVIKAFGNFVMGGNYTVGIVVFSILVIVNFVVITKGAGRIAEVAARFTLDAMPGKQMSIDADLNAGLINEGEARRRRKEIADEADFYGAMDGASKFVRGDAIAAGLLAILGLIPGLPHTAFLFLAALLGGLAYQLRNTTQESELALAGAMESPGASGTAIGGAAKPTDMLETPAPVDLMELQVGYGLIGLVDGDRGGELLERIKAIRKQIAQDLGFMAPPIHIRDNLQLRPNGYTILIKGAELVRGEVMMGHVLAIDPGTAEKGLEGIATREPCFGLPALWVPDSKREQAQLMGYTVVDLASVITTHLTELIRGHAHELLGRQETQALLDRMAKVAPKVVEELIPQAITLGGLVRVLCNLLRERVPIRDMRTILETVADYAPATKDVDALTEYVRQALSRTITHQHLGADDALSVISLDPMLDRQLAEAIQPHAQGAYLSVAPSLAQRVQGAIKQAAERAITRGVQPVLRCSPPSRPHLRRLIERGLSTLPVLSLKVVEGQVRLQSLVVVRIADAN